jgi:hypothetical protein
MTPTSPGGLDVGGADAEEAYRLLSERSSADSGCPVRGRRIVKLSCRLDGRDCEIEVGQPLSGGRDLVLAIFDHGRFEPYRVFSGSGECPPALITRPAVYSVTEYP